MRLLHTSDWHFGRSFHGAPLLEHQVAAVEALVEVVRAERVDVVVVAGDLYDRQLPAADAVEAMSWALCELRAAGARIVGIAGNHDSSARLGFAEPVLAAGGVSIRGDAATAGRAVVVPSSDRGPDLRIYPIPYLEPDVARHRLNAPEARSHDALLRVALGRARADAASAGDCRTVAVAHAFVAGGASCDSERALSVGGAAEVGLQGLGGFDYVALGHLHGRQSLGDGRVRYSGSPLAYSFSERAHTKGAWLVDIAPSGTVLVDAVDLPVPRRLAVAVGTLDELLTDAAHADAERCFVQAVLVDPVLPPAAMVRLRARFPHAVSLTHRPPAVAGGAQQRYAERVHNRTDLDLALDFVAHVTGAPASGAERDDLASAIAAAAVQEEAA